jgi:hypothetical protein
MKILSAVVNNPLFIEIQYYTLKKYMKCEYEFIIFNDSKPFLDFTNGNNENIHIQIKNKCEELGIQCISIPNDHHKTMDCPVKRCADSINFMYQYMLKNKDEYLIIDSDMFLINDFYVENYRQYDCAIVLQNREYLNINYIWNGLFYFNTQKMNDLEMISWDQAFTSDVGGMTYKWLNKKCENLPNVVNIRNSEKNIFNKDGIYFIKHLWSLTWNDSEMPEKLKNTKLEEFIKKDPRNQNGKYFCEIYDDIFLHYRAGGDWQRKGLNFHNELTQKLKNSIL